MIGFALPPGKPKVDTRSRNARQQRPAQPLRQSALASLKETLANDSQGFRLKTCELSETIMEINDLHKLFLNFQEPEHNREWTPEHEKYREIS